MNNWLRRFLQPKASGKPLRVLFIVNGTLPTLEIYFMQPLQPLIAAGKIRVEVLTETELGKKFKDRQSDAARSWAQAQITAFQPDLVVFCRYSGAQADAMLAQARAQKIPTIYHIDDDLLGIPIEFGARKYQFHNAPERLAAVRTLLAGVDLIYAAGAPLVERLRSYGITTPAITGAICRAATVQRSATAQTDRVTIGYMGFDHAHDFELVLPALVTIMRENPQVSFELFGSIPQPAALDEFTGRVTVVPPVMDYAAFQQAFVARHWDIGICPLADTSFNRVKTPIKWIDYTAAGIAVIATGGMMYDAYCANGCGKLAYSQEDWRIILDELIRNGAARQAMVERAQARLATEFTPARLQRQVLDAFHQVLPGRTASFNDTSSGT